MIAAIVWKELREQRSIALVVLAFGVLALVLTAQFVEPMKTAALLESAGARELMAPAIIYLAGIVCGALLLADEKEVGTFEFLDSLPCRRWQLWVGKVLFGVGLTVLQAAFFTGVALALGCAPPTVSGLSYLIAMTFFGLLAFSWGLLGGALAKSTLGAVFQGAVLSTLAGLLLAVPAVIMVGSRTHGMRFFLVTFAHLIAWLGAGLIGSAVIFTALDRRRWSAVTGAKRTGKVAARRSPWPRFGITALTWLSIRQVSWIMIGAFAAGIAFGAMMLLPDAHPFLIWPSGTLALGVLAGVTTMGEEQTRGVARFWAERRLPLGRMWLTKTAVHFSIAVLAATLMLIPLFAVSPALPFRSHLFDEHESNIRSDLFRFVWVGLVYGFVVGHLTAMIFRKTVVAGLVAAITAATLVGVIAPSILCGGAAAWQVWGPGAVLLLTARLLLYPWATERVFGAGPLFRALAGGGLATSLLAAGIVYRVYEIPNVSNELAASGFEDRIPSRDTNESGKIVRSAALQFRRSAEAAKGLYPATARAPSTPVAGPGGGARPGAPPPDESDILERVARLGSPEDVDSLKPWLKAVFSENWPALLNELDGKPAGVFEDPRDLDFKATYDDPRAFREMMLAIRARGIEQLQTEGDILALVRFAPGALAACRTARNLCGWRTPFFALQAEEVILEGVSDWIAEVDGPADQVRLLHSVLARHEREMPVGVEDAFWADRVIMRNTLDRVGMWLPQDLDPQAARGTKASPQAEAEAELIGIAWNVPWERARRDRILRVSTHADMQVSQSWLSGIHQRQRWRTDRGSRLAEMDRRCLTLRRAVRLQVAVRLFQLEHPEPLQKLAQLVPEYLPEVPVDPYTEIPNKPDSSKPFRYRQSGDEVIEVGGIGRISLPGPFGSTAAEVAGAVFLSRQWPAALAPLAAVARLDPPQPALARGAGGLMVMSATLGQGTAPPPKNLNVVPDSGIIWSVGPDRRDDGGTRTPRRGSIFSDGQDWVFIVPPPRVMAK
jgi:hypothetical protein